MVGIFYVLTLVKLCLVLHILVFTPISVDAALVRNAVEKFQNFFTGYRKADDRIKIVENEKDNTGVDFVIKQNADASKDIVDLGSGPIPNLISDNSSTLKVSKKNASLRDCVQKCFSEGFLFLRNIASLVGAFGQILEYSKLRLSTMYSRSILDVVCCPFLIIVLYGYNSLLADPKNLGITSKSLLVAGVCPVIFLIIMSLAWPRGDLKKNLLHCFPCFILVFMFASVIPQVNIEILRGVEDAAGYILSEVVVRFAAILAPLYILPIIANILIARINFTSETFFCAYITFLNTALVVLNFYASYFIIRTSNSPIWYLNLAIVTMSVLTAVSKLRSGSVEALGEKFIDDELRTPKEQQNKNQNDDENTTNMTNLFLV